MYIHARKQAEQIATYVDVLTMISTDISDIWYTCVWLKQALSDISICNVYV